MRDQAEDARTAFLQDRYYSIVAAVIAKRLGSGEAGAKDSGPRSGDKRAHRKRRLLSGAEQLPAGRKGAPKAFLPW